MGLCGSEYLIGLCGYYPISNCKNYSLIAFEIFLIIQTGYPMVTHVFFEALNPNSCLEIRLYLSHIIKEFLNSLAQSLQRNIRPLSLLWSATLGRTFKTSVIPLYRPCAHLIILYYGVLRKIHQKRKQINQYLQSTTFVKICQFEKIFCFDYILEICYM